MVYFWSAIGGFIAIAIETVYRGTDKSWLSLLPVIGVPALLINFCVYQSIKHSTSLLGAFIAFSFTTLTLRLLSSLLVLHDPISKGTWAAFGLMVIAQVLKTFWK